MWMGRTSQRKDFLATVLKVPCNVSTMSSHFCKKSFFTLCIETMDVETEMMLIKHTDSYWMLLPPEIKELILKYKESQELIEWRESFVSRRICLQIEDYGRLRREWCIGRVQCTCYRLKACQCQPGCFYIKIYGHYWHLSGDRRQVFLDSSLSGAIPRCDSVKNRIWYQTNDIHTMNIIEYL